MTTRMTHPQHGATHAYDTGEIEKLQKLGWSVEVPVINGDTHREPEDVIEEQGEGDQHPAKAGEVAKRKPGRPRKA
jgi:hypothetical protein